MSDARQVIADVLRKHQWSIVRHQCRCDDPGTPSEWPAHAAAMVDAALGGLTRELSWRVGGVSGLTLPESEVSSNDAEIIARRWVSGWTPEERSEK